MDERRCLRSRVVAIVVVVGAVAQLLPACESAREDGVCVDETPARTLDAICDLPDVAPGVPACSVAGAAKETTGISEDTRGYKLDGGALVIRLSALEAVTDFRGLVDVEALAARTGGNGALTAYLTWGSCGVCGQDPAPYTVKVDEDYGWVQIISAEPTHTERDDGSEIKLPPDATLTLTGNGVDLADVRTRSTYSSCAIVGPIGARRR
jgi:hypothetical protein